jgi:hypothetical protein
VSVGGICTAKRGHYVVLGSIVQSTTHANVRRPVPSTSMSNNVGGEGGEVFIAIIIIFRQTQRAREGEGKEEGAREGGLWVQVLAKHA